MSTEETERTEEGYRSTMKEARWSPTEEGRWFTTRHGSRSLPRWRRSVYPRNEGGRLFVPEACFGDED
jgi:hypothetical protein